MQGLGDNCLTSMYVKKVLILRQTLGYFSTLDLTQTLELVSPNYVTRAKFGLRRHFIWLQRHFVHKEKINYLFKKHLSLW